MLRPGEARFGTGRRARLVSWEYQDRASCRQQSNQAGPCAAAPAHTSGYGGVPYIGDFILYRETENEEMLSVATMGTISLRVKDIERSNSKRDGYHGYHERSRGEFGLHGVTFTPRREVQE